jgi:hypothetical protein
MLHVGWHDYIGDHENAKDKKIKQEKTRKSVPFTTLKISIKFFKKLR